MFLSHLITHYYLRTSLINIFHSVLDLQCVMKILEDVSLSATHFSTVLLSLQLRETPSVIATQFIITAIDRMRTYNFLTLSSIARLMKTKEQDLFVEQSYAMNIAYMIWHLVSDVCLLVLCCVHAYAYLLLSCFHLFLTFPHAHIQMPSNANTDVNYRTTQSNRQWSLNSHRESNVIPIQT